MSTPLPDRKNDERGAVRGVYIPGIVVVILLVLLLIAIL
jgi:hypothetical protein